MTDGAEELKISNRGNWVAVYGNSVLSLPLFFKSKSILKQKKPLPVLPGTPNTPETVNLLPPTGQLALNAFW